MTLSNIIFSTKAAMFLLVLSCNSLVIKAQISGNVYWDVNNNGSRSAAGTFPNEKGVYGVVVNAYNTSNTIVATTSTNGTGNYSLPSVTSFPVRLEFITPNGTFAAKRTAGNASNVRFVTAPLSNADLGVASNKYYATANNHFAASSAPSNGNATAATNSGDAGLRQALYIFPYNLNNTVKTGVNYENRFIGSTYGLAFQKETRTLLIAAYLKRHAGFGPGGIDAIYKTKISLSGDADAPSVYCNLNTLGINVGANPRTVALPDNADVPNTDAGVFGLVGKIGIGGIEISEDGKDLFVANMYQNKIHRINIGMPAKNSITAADVTANWLIPGPGLAGTEWHIMSVKNHDGKIYVGGIASKQRTDAPDNTQADLDADHVNLRAYVYAITPATGVVTEVLQFPLNYRRGQVIDQFRYEFKTNWWRAWQNNGDADILRNDFNDGLETFPQPSAPYNTVSNTGIIYPQPMLADLEFDGDGAMIIGLRDRFGDQGGLNNYFEGVNGNVSTSGGNFFRVFACGEVLRAGKAGSTWTIENNATVTSNGVTTSSNNLNVQGSPPAGASSFSGTFNPTSGSPWGWDAAINKNFGPGGRYYYYNQAFTNAGVPLSNFESGSINLSTVHYVKSNGGLALLAGSDEVINTAISPEGRTFTAGVLRFSNLGLYAGTNAGNMTDQQELIPGSAYGNPGMGGSPASFGKANGIGDVEILCDAMSIEIGNIVWNDANSNGIQDANETGKPNITVLLRSPGNDGIFGTGDDETWTTITDSEGHYYFDNTNVNDSRKVTLGFIGIAGNSGILNGQQYRIEINPVQAGLTGFVATDANLGTTLCDNDGLTGNLSNVGNRIYANVNTAFNDYNYDFGFKPEFVLAADKIVLQVTVNNQKASLEWVAENEINTDKYIIEKSLNNSSSFVFAGEKPASGFAVTAAYTFEHDFSNEPGSSILYRVKLLDKDGKIKYSNTVTVKKSGFRSISITPNPVKNSFVVNFYAAASYTAQLKIIAANGTLVYRNTVTVKQGNNLLPVNKAGQIPSGNYVVQITGVNGQVYNKQFFKQ